MTTADRPEIAFSTLAPGLMADPYPAYAALRAGPPIFWSAEEAAWVVHRHRDVAAALADARFAVPEVAELVAGICARGGRQVPDLHAFLSAVLLLRNPPDHTEARQFLAAVLTARPVSSHAPLFETTTRGLLAEAPRDQTWDAATAYADQVPRRFMARLLGLADDQVAALVAAAMEVAESFDRGRSFRFYERMDRTVREARGTIDAAIALRRRQPRDDGLSRMIALSDERFRLDDGALANRALFLLFAGIETTAALIGNAIAAVLDHPDAARRLQANPTLVQAAIEETQCYDPPVQQLSRIASADLDVAGQRVRAGERLVLLLGAANRDPAAHADPDRFDLDRAVRRHLGFGAGLHFCLGASLARLEAQIALRELMACAPRLDASRDRRWWRHRTVRRLAALPLILS